MPEGELQLGMYPTPPNLSSVDGLDPTQTFWVIKHGVKMSGMPAWGKSMDNSTIWGMTAFVRRLPGMTPETYAALVASSGGHDHGGGAAPGGDGHADGGAGHAGMDHGEMSGMKSSDMAGLDHGDMPGMKSSDMAGMDHGDMPGMKSSDMAGMDHGDMPGMKSSDMAGMDHSATGDMDMKVPPPRRISGPAEAALQAFQDALEVGNMGLALDRLDPELVHEESATGHVKARATLLKNAKVQLLSREVQAGRDQTVIVSESRITTSGAARPIDLITTERATLRASSVGWTIVKLEFTSRPAVDGAAE